MEKSKIENLQAAVYWISVNYQQNFYEISSDWNKYMPNEHVYLKKYIGYALYGPPDFEEIVDDDEKDECNYVYKEKGSMELIDNIYSKIVEHGTQMTEENEVLCSILYTCIYDENSLLKCDEDKVHEIIYIKPIFKIQKNVKKKNNVELQMWYVDSECRVYKSWEDYLSNNNLPTCIMIAPKDGIYQADLKEVWSEKSSTVWVQVHSNNKSRKITRAIDTTSSLLNIGCLGIGIAAMINPISAPVAITALIGGTATGVWGGGRAIGELVDRGRHDQSVTNRHAIPAWLGVAGNTLGLAASGGSALLSRAIRSGTTVTKSAQIAHDAIIISNIVVNVSGVGFNSVTMYQKYTETGEISPKEVFFLTAHLLFVCNSVIQMRVASDIIKSNSEQVIKDYEMTLRSKKHQKAFRSLVRNTRNAATNKAQGNEEIIRAIKRIKNKDDFFAAVSRSRKLFNAQGVQISFSDGQVSIDGVSMISPSSFASMGKDNMVSLINQATSGINVQATSSTSFFRSTIIPSNVLKAGIETLRNFYVIKSVQASEPVENKSKDYEEIIGDLRENPDKTKILNFLLESGLSIAEKVANPQYTVDTLLSESVNFIWRYIKTNFGYMLPGVKMFEEQYRTFLLKIVKSTHNYIKSNVSEWTNAFRNYMRSMKSEKTELKCDDDSKTNLFMNSSKDLPVKYNDMEMLDPTEVMFLPEETLTKLIEEALFSCGSKLNNTNKLSRELIKMCEEEFKEFFFKHPTAIDFKVAELANELKGILSDLSDFSQRNIIFYKLIVISINIARNIFGDQKLMKKDVVNIMKGLWILVCMNFQNIAPDTYMLEKEYEGFIINIIIAIYNYQTKEPVKWSSAFTECKSKYNL